MLHPLKSGLNWPVGEKEPLDYSCSQKLGVGIRWKLQWHLSDAVFYAKTKKMTVPFEDSREALLVLDGLAAVIERGIKEQKNQHTPRLVLLDRAFS